MMPVVSTAQQRRGDDRRAVGASRDRDSGQRQSTQRQSDQRRSNDRRADQRRSDRDDTDRRPAPAVPRAWWEHQQAPWWERQGPPSWEQNKKPAAPAWQNTMNPARTLLNQMREEQQRKEAGDHDGDRDRRHRRFNRTFGSGVLYVVPTYPYIPLTQPETTNDDATQPSPAQAVTRIVPAPLPDPPIPPMGMLRLEVEPKDALQIFVDDVYVGSPTDLGDEISLVSGTRRIELRASGYEPLGFDAEIVESRLITFRGALERDASVAPAPVTQPATPGSKTMYLIPGCYLGNVAPKEINLRPGCDLSKLTTITP